MGKGRFLVNNIIESMSHKDHFYAVLWSILQDKGLERHESE